MYPHYNQVAPSPKLSDIKPTQFLRQYIDQLQRVDDHNRPADLRRPVDLDKMLGDMNDDIPRQGYIPRRDYGPKENVPAQVGDINSNKVGSGARYNAGKPDLSLIPAIYLFEFAHRSPYYDVPQHDGKAILNRAFRELHAFQMREGDKSSDFERLRDTFCTLDNGSLIEDTARVFEYGRRKYAAWNWAKGQAWSVPIASALRHMLAILRGEETDPESGLPHRAHAACNVVMLMWFLTAYPEGDDRFVPPVPVSAEGVSK